MFLKKCKQILTFPLLLAMLLSILPSAALAANSAECLHENVTVLEEKVSTCQDPGCKKWSCNTCGQTGEELLDILPHSYESGLCTMCGKDAPGKQFTRTNIFTSGDSVVFYNPFTETALSFDDSTGKISASKVAVENDVLTIAEDTAVFTVRLYDELGITLQTYKGEYLTGDDEDLGLYYTREISDCSRWYIYNVPESYVSDGLFLLENFGMYIGSPSMPCVQFMDEQFSIGGKHANFEFVGDERFYFHAYTTNGSLGCEHSFDEGVVEKESTCKEEGIKIYTCTRCGKTREKYLSLASHNWEENPGSTVCYSSHTCSTCGTVEEYAHPTGHYWAALTCNEPAMCKDCCTTGGVFTKINGLDSLADGDRVVLAITVKDELVALDRFIQDNGLPCGSYVESAQNTLTRYTDATIWTVVQTESGFALHRPEGYLTLKDDKSGFCFDDSGSSPYSWQITEEDGHYQIATATGEQIVKFNGTCAVDGAYNLHLATEALGEYDFADVTIFKHAENATRPHFDADGDNLCDNCSEVIEEATLLGRTLCLNGKIAVNFVMSLSPDVVADENSYMLFTQEGKEPVRLYHKDRDERNFRGSDSYVYTYEVSAMEMTDIITAQYFYGDGQCSEIYTYSVKEYADNMREKLSDNQPLANLLDAMLRYGAASQIQFNYHTERMADEGLEPVDYSTVSIEGYSKDTSRGTDLVTLAGASLLLQSETTIRFYLRADASAEDFTVTYKGQPLERTPRSYLYSVDIGNISAPDLDEVFTITVNDGMQTADISYSPLTYCASIRKNASGLYTQTLQDVAAALYLYSQAANEFFTPAQ